jgi:hypothetical protein
MSTQLKGLNSEQTFRKPASRRLAEVKDEYATGSNAASVARGSVSTPQARLGRDVMSTLCASEMSVFELTGVEKWAPMSAFCTIA